MMFIMPTQVELSTYSGVDDCVCTISSNVVHTTIASLELINRAAHSSSKVDAITFLIICDMTRIVPLFSHWLKFCAPKQIVPQLGCGTDIMKATIYHFECGSLWIFSCILLWHLDL